jgi:SCP-2 sterol transfer family
MTGSPNSFLAALVASGHEPLLESVNGSIRFDVLEGGQIEPCTIRIDDGDVTMSRDTGEAECVLRLDRAMLESITTGELNAITAFLRGELCVEGDMQMLVRFHRLLPGPAAGVHSLAGDSLAGGGHHTAGGVHNG